MVINYILYILYITFLLHKLTSILKIHIYKEFDKRNLKIINIEV